MITNITRAGFAASVLTIAAFSAPSFVNAQTVQGGSSGGVQGRDVSAGTYGSGQFSRNPDGTAIGVTGGGDATAANGGSASTESSAKLNDRRAMQRSTAQAQDEDERARSRTRTVVREDEVRSRTTSRYKARGEKPVRESTYTVTTPEGTTTRQR